MEPIVQTLVVEFPVSQEQLEALQKYTDEFNNNSGTSTISERLREDVLAPWVEQRVNAAYEASVQRLGQAAKNLSYAQRTALIQQVSQQLPT